MTPEQIQEVANLQDTNTYHVEIHSEEFEIELKFDMKVDMKYQLWLEMHEFWAGYQESLEDAGGDVIKRVLQFYGKRIIGHLADGHLWSDKGVNKFLEDEEGICHSPYVVLSNVEFEIDLQLETEYRCQLVTGNS